VRFIELVSAISVPAFLYTELGDFLATEDGVILSIESGAYGVNFTELFPQNRVRFEEPND
jgi:hypothetical protein